MRMDDWGEIDNLVMRLTLREEGDWNDTECVCVCVCVCVCGKLQIHQVHVLPLVHGLFVDPIAGFEIEIATGRNVR
jgi:hypothetical protein